MSVCKKNILLVDDEKAFILSLAEGLKDCIEGFEILIAEDGRKALEAFRAGNNIELMVTDLKMPEMSGLELLAAVKQEFPYTRAIVLTAFITPEIEKELNDLGNYVCIEKPIEFEELKQKIMGELGLPPIRGGKFNIEEELERLEFLTETYLAP